jgi:3-phenylpropionate/trans-cinnamate dioxygenase ferredoxin reductase subunit
MSSENEPKTVVILGAGHASGQAAASLRQEGFEGKIVLIGEEPYLPYQRPPLSKKFLAGELGIERVYFKPPEFYDAAKVDVHLNARASAIDAGAKQVTLENGERIAYDKLILTTGSRVRRLNCPGHDLAGVHYLRTIADVEAIQGQFTEGKRLVIVGAGYVGLEVAAVAVKRGLEVHVLEMESRVLARVTSPEISQFFHDEHTAAGVQIHYEHALATFEGEEALQKITCSNGFEVEADLAIVGIGIIPNTELAEAAGVTCNNGICVDALCQTSDPDILAAGDCTEHPNGIYDRRIRLESVHNALEQAKTAAANICGKEKPYCQVPWFWSDQYDLKLQMAGLNQGYTEVVVRGDPASRKFAAFYLKDGVLVAVDAVNAAPEYMMGRKLIGEKAKVAPERLSDITLSMKEVASA